MIRFALAAAILAVSACAARPPVEPTEEAVIADGREIAQRQCSGCHVIGATGDSPNAAAPPFRTVLSRYSADVLEEELINGIRVAHPMPEFQFNPQGVDELIAYLRAVQTEPATAR